MKEYKWEAIGGEMVDATYELTDLDSVYFKDIKFINCIFIGVTLTDAKLINIVFENCTFKDTNFSYSFLEKCLFSNSTLRSCIFILSELHSVVWKDCNVILSSFGRATLVNCSNDGSNFEANFLILRDYVGCNGFSWVCAIDSKSKLMIYDRSDNHVYHPIIAGNLHVVLETLRFNNKFSSEEYRDELVNIILGFVKENS